MHGLGGSTDIGDQAPKRVVLAVNELSAAAVQRTKSIDRLPKPVRVAVSVLDPVEPAFELATRSRLPNPFDGDSIFLSSFSARVRLAKQDRAIKPIVGMERTTSTHAARMKPRDAV